jgi:hypothetical protein
VGHGDNPILADDQSGTAPRAPAQGEYGTTNMFF